MSTIEDDSTNKLFGLLRLIFCSLPIVKFASDRLFGAEIQLFRRAKAFVRDNSTEGNDITHKPITVSDKAEAISDSYVFYIAFVVVAAFDPKLSGVDQFLEDTICLR